jgi:hypothetical protein
MTEKKHQVYQLLEPSTESVTDATFQLIGRKGIIRFDYYRDGTAYRSAIRFTGVVSSRTTSERCCTAWQIEDSYDTLCEVEESTWLKVVKEQMPERYRDELAVRHFMIYLDSAGCFEVLADGFEEVTEETGSWKELKNSLVS